MATFGRYLREHGVVSPEQLEEATQVMVVYGGRLGTVLVEAGALTLEQVENHLSAHLDLPCAPLERLERPESEALEAISVDLARRHGALPMWIEKRTLHVALLEPNNPNRIDELAFITSLGISPYVIAERRLVQLLERHYGIRPDPRFTDYRILEVAGHVRPMRKRRAETDRPVRLSEKRPPPTDDETSRRRTALGIRPLGDDEELSRDEEFESLQTDPPLPALGASRASGECPSLALVEPTSGPAPARSPAEVAELEGELALLAPREAVASLVLRIASFYVRAAAFFAVRRGMIEGVKAAGELPEGQVAGIYLPVSARSLLAGPATDAEVFRGRPATEGIDADLMRLLGRETGEVAAFPILLRGRVVSLLYVDNGADALADSLMAALGALAETASAAYERLLLAGQQLC